MSISFFKTSLIGVVCQRCLHRVIAAHAVHAASGRSASGTKIYPRQWCAIQPARGPEQKLKRSLRASQNVAAGEVRIKLLETLWSKDMPGKNQLSKPRGKALNLRFDSLGH